MMVDPQGRQASTSLRGAVAAFLLGTKNEDVNVIFGSFWFPDLYRVSVT